MRRAAIFHNSDPANFHGHVPVDNRRLVPRTGDVQPRDVSAITYRAGNDIDLETVRELYRSSTLGERRPVEDRERMSVMLRNANLVVSAWDGELLVGIARSLTDFVYCTYLSDLAVRVSHQRHGIGRELVRRTQQLGGQATVILLSAPKAADYYPRIGLTAHPSAWTLKSDETLR
jgi:predicted N-acetyltransferase YhbS